MSWTRAIASTAFLCSVMGCSSQPSTWQPPHETSRHMPPDGKEAIYSFISQGNLEAANEALKNIWDLGPRSAPIPIDPITWFENPFDKYWRVLFYSLRPLSNLLFAYYVTGDVAFKDKLFEVIRSYDAFEVRRGDAPHPYFDDPHTAAFRAMMLVNI